MTISSLCFKFEEENCGNDRHSIVRLVGKKVTYLQKIWDNKPSSLRLKFLGLFFYQLISGITLRLGLRLVDMSSCSFSRGFKKGERLFNQYALEQCLSNQKIDHFFKIRKEMIAKTVAKEVAISVTKAVLYPLAIIALQAITLLGIIAPYGARYLYGQVEKKFAVGDQENMLYVVIGCVTLNFSAVCMQDDSIWNSRNLYIYYNNTSLKGKISNIFTQVSIYTKNNLGYFTKQEKLNEALECLKQKKEDETEENRLKKHENIIPQLKKKIASIDQMVKKFHNNESFSEEELNKKIKDLTFCIK